MELFIVGKWVDNLTCTWEFCGIFDDRKLAEEQCLTEYFFVGPCKLNETIEDKTASWPGLYYPKIEGFRELESYSEKEVGRD